MFHFEGESSREYGLSGFACRVEVDVSVFWSLVRIEGVVGDVGWSRGCSAFHPIGDIHVVVARRWLHDREFRPGTGRGGRLCWGYDDRRETNWGCTIGIRLLIGNGRWDRGGLVFIVTGANSSCIGGSGNGDCRSASCASRARNRIGSYGVASRVGASAQHTNSWAGKAGME